MRRFLIVLCALCIGVLCLAAGCESTAPRDNVCDPNPCVDANHDPLIPNRSLCTATSGGAICDCDWNYVENASGDCAYAWCHDCNVLEEDPPCNMGCLLDHHCEVVGSALAATCETNVCEPACNTANGEVCVESADADGNQIFVCGCGVDGTICEAPETCQAGECL